MLNAAGQLAPLADLLDGKNGAAADARDLIPVLRALDAEFDGLAAVRATSAPGGQTRAVCGEVRTRGWFAEKVRYVGVLVRCGGRPAILGHGVSGYRDQNSEFIIKDVLTFQAT